MVLQKFRWSKVYESSEEELVEFLRDRGIAAERFKVEEFQASGARSFSVDSTIWCAEGSLTFVSDGYTISLQPGDSLRVPANTNFETTAGMAGFVCYESTITVPPAANK